jgi:hypothetical protein
MNQPIRFRQSEGTTAHHQFHGSVDVTTALIFSLNYGIRQGRIIWKFDAKFSRFWQCEGSGELGPFVQMAAPFEPPACRFLAETGGEQDEMAANHRGRSGMAARWSHANWHDAAVANSAYGTKIGASEIAAAAIAAHNPSDAANITSIASVLPRRNVVWDAAAVGAASRRRLSRLSMELVWPAAI